VPLLLVFVGAWALDAGTAAPPAWYGATVVLIGGVLLWTLRPAAAAPGGHRAAAGWVGAVVVIGVAGALAVLVQPHVPGVRGRPADARALVAAPVQPRTGVNPLQQFGSWRTDPAQLRMTGTSSRRLDVLRLVTLPDFTGQSWTTDARYRRSGRLVGPTSGQQVAVSVSVTEPGPLGWLLQPGRPSSVSVDDLGIDEATGDLAVPAGRTYPPRYMVTGAAPAVPTAALAADRAAARHGPVVDGAASVPRVISDFAKRATLASGGYRQLLTLQRQLQDTGFYVDDRKDAPGGSGLYQITALLRPAGVHAGTSEQYASAFAVSARILGYDARVVLGFVPRYASGHRFVVTGADVHAWAEVRFAHAGWVTFDPTPDRPVSLARRTPPPPPQSAQPSAGRSNAASSAPPQPRSAPRSAGAHVATGAGGAVDVTPWVALAGGLLVVLLMTPPTAKALVRRRRRRARSPARAVHGAWLDTLDRLVESGTPVGSRTSSAQVVAATSGEVRTEVRYLATVHDRAGYAPEAAPPDDVGQAWHHANRAARALRAPMPVWRRVLARLDPRPLWPRR
jgi:hypothetical protein